MATKQAFAHRRMRTLPRTRRHLPPMQEGLADALKKPAANAAPGANLRPIRKGALQAPFLYGSSP